jgi:hypothetical protein
MARLCDAAIEQTGRKTEATGSDRNDKPDDAKPGDAKPGDAKPDDAKPVDAMKR